jgi:D-sedoheptulose 7-phosphate isomerase
MQDLVRRQLAQSIRTMQAVHDDAALHETMLAIGKLTAERMQAGGKLLVAGNGGSAADSQHLVAEFVARLTIDRPALRAVALTTDSSILTAIGNDWSYEVVFSRQIEALALPGDVFLAISTSGNSKNLVRALEVAKALGVHTIGFTGNDGGRMRQLCDHNIIIPSTVTMNIQESHLALEHIFCMLVERYTFGVDFDRASQALAE